MSHWESRVVAQAYAAARPQYPHEMHKYIASFLKSAAGPLSNVPAHIVDVGCGSGQATGDLMAFVGDRAKVVGVDTSKSQIEMAQSVYGKKAGMAFTVATAENFAQVVAPFFTSEVPPQSQRQSVVFVAQAMHWFDIPAFADQCRQFFSLGDDGCPPASNKGWLMAATYLLFRTSKTVVNDLILELDGYLMGHEFWPPQRKHIDNNYVTLKAQLRQEGFDLISMSKDSIPDAPTATFTYQKEETTLGETIAYLGTWSSVQRWRAANDTSRQQDILDKFRSDVITTLGAANHDNPDEIVLGCEFPVSLFIYRCGSDNIKKDK